MSDLIQKRWAEYTKMCMPDNVPISVRMLFRRAYFMGAQGCFLEMLENTEAVAAPEGEEGFAIKEAVIASIKEELMQFLLDQQKSPNTPGVGPLAKPN